MDKGKYNDIARILGALGTGKRVEILHLLRRRALCVGAIAKQLEISQSAVSQHLRVLKDAKLVTAERKGYFVHYRINEKTFSRISTFAKGFIADPKQEHKLSDSQRR